MTGQQAEGHFPTGGGNDNKQFGTKLVRTIECAVRGGQSMRRKELSPLPKMSNVRRNKCWYTTRLASNARIVEGGGLTSSLNGAGKKRAYRMVKKRKEERRRQEERFVFVP